MDNKTIETISYLARLKLDKDKKDIDTKDIAPLANPLEKVAPKREDSVTSKSRKEAFLSNSPESDKDYFMVPKVVE